jgi:hypothetical protein
MSAFVVNRGSDDLSAAILLLTTSLSTPEGGSHDEFCNIHRRSQRIISGLSSYRHEAIGLLASVIIDPKIPIRIVPQGNVQRGPGVPTTHPSGVVGIKANTYDFFVADILACLLQRPGGACEQSHSNQK